MLLKMKLNIGVVDRGTNFRRDSLASRATLIFINARAKAMRNYASQLALVARPSRRLVDRPTFIVQRSESSSLLGYDVLIGGRLTNDVQLSEAINFLLRTLYSRVI